MTRVALVAAFACFGLLCMLTVAGPSQGRDGAATIVLDLDRAGFALSARDGKSVEPGPAFSIALGSPARSTPSGSYPLHRVILRPAWHPGSAARSAGARPENASLDTPMGVAKIPFADGGEIALHGGGDPRVLGKPVSGGCVRATDADILRLIAWLDLQGALAPPQPQPSGEVHRSIIRPVRLRVH